MGYFIVALMAAVFSLQCLGSEKVGKLEVSDLYISPYFSYVEGRSGGFYVGDSLLGIRWTLDPQFTVQAKFGSSDLIYRPQRYTILNSATSTLTVIEGYAQYSSALGRLRFGRVPLGFGLEGLKTESELVLPRSFVFSRGIIGVRDDGLSYDVEFGSVFSNWTISNGEGNGNLDNEAWLTVQAGLLVGDNMRLAFSGQTGRSKPSSTNPNGSTPTASQNLRAGFDLNSDARHRLSAASMDWSDRNGGVAALVGIHESETGTEKSKGSFGNVDGWFKFSPTFWALGRFQYHDVRYDQPLDRIEEGILAFSIRDSYGLRQLNFMGIRRYQEGQPKLEHEFRISLSMSPTLN